MNREAHAQIKIISSCLNEKTRLKIWQPGSLSVCIITENVNIECQIVKKDLTSKENREQQK